MKKTGIIVIVLIILVIAITSGTSYAFFTAGSVEFSILIQGAEGSELSIDLASGEQDKTLKPAKTTSQNNVYTNVDNGDFAMYELDYASGSIETIYVHYSISDVKYMQGTEEIEPKYATFLNNYMQYAFLWGKIENGEETLTKEGALASTNINWISQTTQSSEQTVATGEVGKLYVFVRVNPTLTDELLPPVLNNITVKFTIATSIVKQSESQAQP